MKFKIFILFMCLVTLQIRAQSKSYTTGKIYIEMMNTKTNQTRNTQYLGSVKSIAVYPNEDIDIEFSDKEGGSNLILLKNLPEMASSSFNYMIDVNSKTKEEFFVKNLIYERGMIILLSASFRDNETLRIQIINIQ